MIEVTSFIQMIKFDDHVTNQCDLICLNLACLCELMFWSRFEDWNDLR
jgi:hypothetical protein